MSKPSREEISYDHHLNYHSVSGAAAALPAVFAGVPPVSLLDVGCGAGTWLRAALDSGVGEVAGVEGVRIPDSELLVGSACVRILDLSQSWSLGRKYDLVLCLEVAEHIAKEHAPMLIASLAEHADHIVFSAAIPRQSGQNHVNCQWPEFWQNLFNGNGFVCEDDIRGSIWLDTCIEPWYRQNMFRARRDPARAGTEPRIRGMIHPDILETIVKETTEQTASAFLRQITDGKMPHSWYAKTAAAVVREKAGRYWNRFQQREKNAGKPDS